MLKITTNNHPRPIIAEYELSAEERKEFDYLDWDAIDRGEDSRSFFRYRGQLYDLNDIPSTRPGMWGGYPELHAKGWDGFASDSFFSGVAVRYTEDFESVVVALVTC